MPTPPLKLDATDWRHIARDLMLGVVAAGLAWLSTEYLPALQNADNQKIAAAAAILTPLVIAAHRWLRNKK
jgi:hypothetical protein